jgi:hypothetical protein
VFKPEAAGRYRIRLTVKARDGKKGSDSTVIPVDPSPAVTVDTHAREGDQVGVRISTPSGHLEDHFYPGDFTKWLQVVVLDRDDLGEISNKSYDCPQATTYRKPSEVSALKPCIDTVKAALDGLKKPAEKLVIVTSPWREPSDFGVQPPNGASQVFGSPPGWWKPDQQVWRGTYSAIGPAGGCCRFTHASNDQTGPYFGDTSGDIRALLVRDNQSRYSLAPQPLQFNTQAPGSDATHSVMQIGTNLFTEDAPYGGFHVLVADPDTLQAKSYYFLTNTGDPRLYLGRMHNVLHDAIVAGSGPNNRRPLVFITSHGDAAPPRTTPAVNDDLARLASDIEQLDGTRTAFLNATEDLNPRSYALVTSAPATTGAQENLGPEGTTAAVPVTGTVARTNPYYAYGVQQGNALPASQVSPATGTNQLLQTVGREGERPWPEAGKPERTAAIEFVGKQVLGTDQPRTQFWTIRWTEGRWGPVYDDIGRLCTAPPIPDGCKSSSFKPIHLAWAKAELQREITWMNSAHTYLNDLATPFQKDVLGSWADLESIAARVAARVDLTNKTVEVKTDQVVDKAWDIVEEVPVLGEAVGAVRNVYDWRLSGGRSATIR